MKTLESLRLAKSANQKAKGHVEHPERQKCDQLFLKGTLEEGVKTCCYIERVKTRLIVQQRDKGVIIVSSGHASSARQFSQNH